MSSSSILTRRLECFVSFVSGKEHAAWCFFHNLLFCLWHFRVPDLEVNIVTMGSKLLLRVIPVIFLVYGAIALAWPASSCSIMTFSWLHPWNLTWNLKITCLKRKLIFQTFIFGFHVNFQGCTRNLHCNMVVSVRWLQVITWKVRVFQQTTIKNWLFRL